MRHYVLDDKLCIPTKLLRLPLCQLRPSTIFPPREVSGDRTSEEHENLYLASFPSSVIPGMFLATIMLKGLGGFSKSSHEELMKHSLTIPTAAQHIYGKESKPARKTGQMTLVASSMSQAPILWTRSSAPRTRCKQSKKIFPHPDYPPGCFIPCIPVFSTSSKPICCSDHGIRLGSQRSRVWSRPIQDTQHPIPRHHHLCIPHA